MGIFEIILIGIALSMDACALTIANCTTYKNNLCKKHEWSMPIAFAIFQGLMPLLGYFIGSAFANLLEPITGYLTAGIFLVLGAKIVIDIIKEGKECSIQNKNECDCKKSKFTYSLLIFQAFATSIDALAIGVTFVDLTFSVFLAALVISAVTFILVSAALIFGKKLGELFGKYAEWVGAIILIILAIKSLVEALS